MEKINKTIVSFLILLNISSCTVSSDAEGYFYSFMPGECLSTTDLVFREDDREVDMMAYNGDFLFLFGMVFDNYYEVRTNETTILRVPSNQLFDSFGKNSEDVKQIYLDRLNAIRGERAPDAHFIIASVLYEQGMSLIANKEFAGHPAGENLAPYLTLSEDSIITSPNCLGLPSESCLLTAPLKMTLPVGNSEIVSEDVAFSLEIPVKVVNYLNWINNMISDENAPLLYEEKVLRCDFTVHKRLKSLE